MGYEDIEIVKKKIYEQKKTMTDIYADYVWAGSEKITFQNTLLTEKHIEVMLPKNYTDMSREHKRAKYPLANPPQIIKTNEDGSVNFCFSLFNDNPFSDEQTEEATKIFFGAIKNYNPSVKLLEKDIIKVDNKTFGYFGFSSHGIDMDMYQLFGFSCIKNQLFQFIFNCPFKDSKSWNKVVMQVIQSIKEI